MGEFDKHHFYNIKVSNLILNSSVFLPLCSGTRIDVDLWCWTHAMAIFISDIMVWGGLKAKTPMLKPVTKSKMSEVKN